MRWLGGFSEWESSFRALRHRDFRVYAFGLTVSLIGSWIQNVAQSWLVYRLTHSETMLGMALFATQFPILLLGALGGIAADRYSRKTIVLLTQSAQLVLAVLLAVLTLTGVVTTAHVMILAVLLGVVNAFDLPGRQSLIVQLVGREDVISAVALNSAAFNLSRVIGPSLAGIAVAAFGEGICFLINAVSFVAMIVCLLKTKPAPVESHQGGFASGIMEGFRYAWHRPELVKLLALAGLLNFAFGPVMALCPFFADDIFHRGSAGLGFLVSAMGGGAVFGVLRLARHRGITRLPIVMQMSAIGMGLGLALFAWSPSFWFSMLVIPVIGFSIVRQNAGSNSLIQSVVPDEYRGRVSALFTMVVSGFMPLGSLASGLLAERWGARWVVFAAALLCLAGAAVFNEARKGFQGWVDRQEEACAA